MLQSLPFEGTIKVRNKGVDFALLADKDTAAFAFEASRKLVVCGVSTAVLEVTCLDPIDVRTLAYYVQTTQGLLAMTDEIGNAVRLAMGEEVPLHIFQGNGERELIDAVRTILSETRRKDDEYLA